MEQVLFGIACAAAGFVLGYFFRRATACEGYRDGGIIDEQERGITLGPYHGVFYKPLPTPPGSRSNKPRKPRRKVK